MAAIVDEQEAWFSEITNTPIVDGFIYVGERNADPRVAKAIFSDRELTTPIANPQRTDSAGRSVNKIWTDGRFSIEVSNSDDVQRYIELDNGEGAGAGVTALGDVQGANTITATASPTITAYEDVQQFVFRTAQINTGAVTLNVDGVGAKSVVKNHNEAIAPSEFEADQNIIVTFNQTDDVMEWANQNLKVSNANFNASILAASGLTTSQLQGLALSNGSDADHDIDIAIGSCRDNADAIDITLAAAFGKQIDSSWVPGGTPGAPLGGLSSSLTVANSTWYHVFAIVVGGLSDVGFDTSLTAANLVTDHSATAFRRLGSVLTDGSANILAFTQFGDRFLWTDPPLDVSVTNLSTTATLFTLSTPIDVKTVAIFNGRIRHASAERPVYLSSPDVNDEAPSTTAPPLGSFIARGAATSARETLQKIEVLTNTASQIRARTTGTSTLLDIATLGWDDLRGKE